MRVDLELYIYIYEMHALVAYEKYGHLRGNLGGNTEGGTWGTHEFRVFVVVHTSVVLFPGVFLSTPDDSDAVGFVDAQRMRGPGQ